MKERLKKYSKDAGNLLFTLVISEVISAVFHSEAVASIFASIKGFL
ncbi:hypothetical protein SEENIN0B_02829 [Salmonella enterica subsp. enterica serovar Infantis str. SARB27]|uniref:Uncharacterized protein n=2 Tax=Salmonella enterica I TaxID=59201 RepID=C0PW36_SALPC|nr:hypothetical protein SPC_2806 [Salmonella enterica subsp. enterica serovar Paratyphi C str. RKS4594]EDZ10567.1 hypothetical protein SeSPB_A2927 [Salmonella enterica subsp. enterica serovar Saintpaul str. SARA29]EHB42930.1 hypothetical protein SEENIN0B_02829 [Salmonella enterica subsp. enterica serovar Infantis str. SARB27]